MTTPAPTDYPDAWKRGGARGNPAPREAVAMAVDSYVAALSDSEFQAMVARTRQQAAQ